MAPAPPWSDLPPELLSAIANFLHPDPLDILRFRSVCKSWHSSVSLSPFSLSPAFPLIAPFPSFLHPHSPPSDSYALSVSAVYVLRPPEGVQIEGSSSMPKIWLAFFDQLNPGKVSIRRPFSQRDFVMPLDFPRKLNLLDFHVSEVGRYFNFSDVKHVQCGELVKKEIWSGYIEKVIVFSNGSGVLVLYHEGKLGLLRLGVGNDTASKVDEWQIIHDGKGFRFDDIIDFKGRVLAISRRAKVYEMGYYSSEMNVTVPPITGGGGRRKRLIECLGLLYLVVRCNDRNRFKVYVLNEGIRKWVEVSSIGDLIFFFGPDFSICAQAEEFEGSFGKNCIIFIESSFSLYSDWLHPRSKLMSYYPISVLVYCLEEATHLRDIESCPGYSCMVWPPPLWLWLNKKLKLLGTFEIVVDGLLKGTYDDNLKAKYKELSPFVGAAISGDVISQEGILNMVKQTDILNKFLNQLVVTIDKESKSIRWNIAEDAQRRQLNKKSIHLPNQKATSSLGAEGDHEDEWLWGEMSRRIGTHTELKVLLRGIIRVIDESMDKVKASLKPGEQYSVSASEATKVVSEHTVISPN